MEKEDIIKRALEGHTGGNPFASDQLQAAIGQLSAERSKELTNAIQGLNSQLSVIIEGLRQTVTKNTDKIIQSNESLSRSNERYAKWMKWLTFALVFVGIVQVIVSYTK